MNPSPEIADDLVAGKRRWDGLLYDISEKILESLPISDYARFAAVCVGWRDFQRRHRAAHSPAPPPMLSLPWLFPNDQDGPLLPVASPFERRQSNDQIPISYPLPNPKLVVVEGELSHVGPNGNCGGWLVLGDGPSRALLLNPISRRIIPLPPLPQADYASFRSALTPPPHYAVFLLPETKGGEPIGKVFLVREGDHEWIEASLPKRPLDNFISFGGDLYCTDWDDWDIQLVRGESPSPHMVKITMDVSTLPPKGWFDPSFLVESDGQVMLVYKIGAEYRVFQADLSQRVWVRKKSMDDRIIILNGVTTFSLSSSGLGPGLKGNCIYISPMTPDKPWRVFDLGTGELTYHPNFLGPSPSLRRMFVPSLC